MLAAAPQSRGGAAGEDVEPEKPASARGLIAALCGTGEATVSTRVSVAAANIGCWASPGAMYSVAGVSSSEVAKWEPMPVAFSAAETIH